MRHYIITLNEWKTAIAILLIVITEVLLIASYELFGVILVLTTLTLLSLAAHKATAEEDCDEHEIYIVPDSHGRIACKNCSMTGKMVAQPKGKVKKLPEPNFDV